MASNKRIKIFLKKDNQFLNFMWADTSADGSVMMGLSGTSFSTSVEKVFAREGELLPGKSFQNIDAHKVIKNTKVTFHQSGFYKLISKIKKNSIDRTTIKGLPFKEIIEPTRMLEVLIPAKISISTKLPKEDKDAVIDITKFPNRPLRCTVFCMPVSKINHFNASKKIDTSIIESSCVYEFNNMAWGWTVRVSKEDTVVDERKFYIFVHGDIVWPNRFLFITRVKFLIGNFIKRFF